MFKNAEKLTEVTVPKNVTEADAMFAFSSVERAVFEDGMERIPNNIFEYAGYISDVVIPDSVTDLGRCMFRNAGIKEFTIPKQIEKGEIIFGYSALETISFEEGLTRIPDSLMTEAFDLKTINWTDDITEIGSAAFSSCYALETADIPDTVKTIDKQAFAFCKSLKNVHQIRA